MSSFENQIAVVSGGTRGIGRAITLALLPRALMHATYAGNDEAAAALRDQAAAHGERLALHRFDVADAAAVERFRRGLEESGQDPVQILVASAGILATSCSR